MSNKEFENIVKQQFLNHLKNYFDTDIENASYNQIYYSLSSVINELLIKKKNNNYFNTCNTKKTVHYISIEFLIGKNLYNNLWNLNLFDYFNEYFTFLGINIYKIFNIENDTGLGNGGLGRLAACYLESLAKCCYKSYGHCLKYEYGLFKQKIKNRKQLEIPDEWLKTGKIWLNERYDQSVQVKIYGKVIQHYSDERGLSYELVNEKNIEAVPYDLIISSYGTDNVSILRLWEARASDPIDLHLFDIGELESSLKNDTIVSEVNKVLYPNDCNSNGKDLRLIQQYFLVSAVVQNILNDYFKNYNKIDELPKLISIHINDTHPSLCIPELLRLLIDKYNYGWEDSWNIVTKVISYTNHTILSESLEVKRMSDIEKFIPRIALIIREIDRRFRIDLSQIYKNDYRKIESLSIIQGNNVYMANLAIHASYAVNGVAKIHSEILKNKLFSDYSYIYKDKFINITNGISHRKWLAQSNPKLDKLIVSLIGNDYYFEPEKLKLLEKFENNFEILKEISEIKLYNKKRLANYLKENYDIEIDYYARFDVQAKRIHEYKRQLMNIMKIIYFANKIKNNPYEKFTKQVFIFSGKAASGYVIAKRIIELILSVAKEINNDNEINDKIKVVFIENYNVSIAEILMPATEVTEQISVAGREASGTGNMKAVINGALMVCTDDGANIEICERCGYNNMFRFGLSASNVEKIINNGYRAMNYYENSEKIRFVLNKMKDGIADEKYDDLVAYLLGNSSVRDVYMCLADFDDYVNIYDEIDKVYNDINEWNRRSLHSIANMGYFSSDRSIEEYAQKIWGLN